MCINVKWPCVIGGLSAHSTNFITRGKKLYDKFLNVSALNIRSGRIDSPMCCHLLAVGRTASAVHEHRNLQVFLPLVHVKRTFYINSIYMVNIYNYTEVLF